MRPSYVHGASATPLLGETIGENLDRTVERFGDRDALVVRHQDVRYTYASSARPSTALARALLAAGLEPGDRRRHLEPELRRVGARAVRDRARSAIILVNINPAYRTDRAASTRCASPAAALLVAAPAFKTSDYARDDRRGPRRPARRSSRSCFLDSPDWDDCSPPASGRRRAARAPRLDPVRRPDQHPVHERHHRASPRARRSPTTTSSTTATSSARAAATPSRTGSASRCPSTTASAW